VPFIVVICLAGVFCLAPVALYLLWLAAINRRDRPTIVSGTWDFAALLAGLSGFILFGGGLLLSLVQSNVRFLMRGNIEALRGAWEQEKLAWCLVAGAYLLVVAGGAALVLLARRRTLVIYNVDPAQLEAALGELFDQLGRPVERRGNLWVGGVPLFELEPFVGGRTATLRWLTDDPQMFQEVERHIREAAGALPTGENPAARWLMTSAVGCIVLVVFFVVVLLILFRKI
jgi:hypothetical protein